MIYRHVTGAVLLHFRAATWWAWSSQVKVTWVMFWSAVLWLQWPWDAVWLLVWQCWWRRQLAVVLRVDEIFLTLAISLHFACYLSVDNAYLVSNNSCISAHLLYYRCWQGRQSDECNKHNKIESRSECYSSAWELVEWQVATWLKTRYKSQNKW